MHCTDSCSLDLQSSTTEVAKTVGKFKTVYASKANSQGRAGVPLVISTGSEEAWSGFNNIFGDAFRRIFTDADMTSKISQAWAFGVTKEHRHYGMDTYALGPAGQDNKLHCSKGEGRKTTKSSWVFA